MFHGDNSSSGIWLVTLDFSKPPDAPYDIDFSGRIVLEEIGDPEYDNEYYLKKADEILKEAGWLLCEEG